MSDILELLHVARNSGPQAQLAIFKSLGHLAQLEEGIRIKVVNSVLSNLGSQATQELGLKKLMVCLQQLDEEQLGEAAVKLLPILSKLFTRPESSCRGLAAKCLVQLLRQCPSQGGLGRDIAASIPALITPCMANPAHMPLLVQIMQAYPGPCGPLRNQILEKLSSMIGSGQVSRETLGVCFSLLPQCGGGGREGAEHSNSWAEKWSRVAGSLNKVLDEMLEYVAQGERMGIGAATPGLPIPAVDTASTNAIQRQFSRLAQVQDLGYILGRMVTAPFPQSRLVPVESALHIVIRLLSLKKENVSKRDIPENRVLLCQLPQLYRLAIKLLQDLIVSLEDDLLPEVATVNTLILKALEIINLPQVRKELYNMMVSWVEGVGAANSLELVMDKILSFLAQDVLPQQEKMLLVSSARGRRGGGKKERKGGATAGVSQPKKPPQDGEMASAALTFLGSFVSVSGSMLSESCYLSVCSLAVQLSLTQSLQHPPALVSLYRLMMNLCLSPSSGGLANPLQLALHVLDRASKHPHVEVAREARMALTCLLPIVQPQCPSLHIPLITEDHVRALVGKMLLEAPELTEDEEDGAETLADHDLGSEDAKRAEELVSAPLKRSSEVSAEAFITKKPRPGTESRLETLEQTRNLGTGAASEREKVHANQIGTSAGESSAVSKSTSSFLATANSANDGGCATLSSVKASEISKPAVGNSSAATSATSEALTVDSSSVFESSVAMSGSFSVGSGTSSTVSIRSATDSGSTATGCDRTVKSSGSTAAGSTELDVESMLKDFSDQLKENLLPDPWD